jgi:hypothetical protein
MLTKRLHQIGLRSWQMEIASMGSIGLCIGWSIRTSADPRWRRSPWAVAQR